MKDFRGDLATISLPVLVIHGDQDRVLPYEAYGHGLGDLPGDQIELVAGVPGSDGGTAAVSGDDRAGDVAGASPGGHLRGQRRDQEVRRPDVGGEEPVKGRRE